MPEATADAAFSILQASFAPHVESHIAALTLWQLCQQPERPALHLQSVDRRTWRSGGESLSYRDVSAGDLVRQVLALAAGLRKHGYSPGQRALIMVPPGEEFFVITFACFMSGLVPVFIDPGMDRRSLRASVLHSRPAVFFGTAKAHIAAWLLRLRPAGLQASIQVNGTRLPGCRQLREFLVPEALPSPVGPTAPADGSAAVLFTSGSTGPAKGTIYTHAMFLAQVRAIRSMFGITEHDVDLATFPLFALFAPALGMRAVVPAMDFRRPAKVRSARIFHAVDKHRVTNFFGSPALLNRLSADASEAEARLPATSADSNRIEPAVHAPLASLKRVISAGAPVSHRLIAGFKRLLPPATKIYTPYGATEAMPVSWIEADEILAGAPLTKDGRGIPVGCPQQEIAVRIIPCRDGAIERWDDQWELAPYAIGEIAVAGPVVSPGYDGKPVADSLAKIPWPPAGVSSGSSSAAGDLFLHRMGDLGYRDDSGRIWFCGRKSQRVCLPDSRTLYTVCVEAVFNGHPWVARTALTSCTAPAGGIKVVLFAEPNRRLDRRQKNRLVAELRLMADARPDYPIDAILLHRSFPVDTRHNAKIFREQLGLLAGRRLAGSW